MAARVRVVMVGSIFERADSMLRVRVRRWFVYEWYEWGQAKRLGQCVAKTAKVRTNSLKECWAAWHVCWPFVPRNLRAFSAWARPGSMAGRMVRQLQEGGDIGDTIAIILGVLIILTAVCAFLGWYSRRRG